MELDFYLEKFKKAVDKLDKELLIEKELETETGIWLNSVVLRMQKKYWANLPFERPQSGPSIFFSIWLNEKTLTKNKILYNVHALKLRQLKGYSITSREFASSFRKKFKPFLHDWPNVSLDYGPLTLMEGWIEFDERYLENNVLDLAKKFSDIDFIIDELLNSHRK
jgi:hypothetical protein